MNDVDRYLAALPPDQREALERIREIVKSVVPEATEKISYQMPAFFYQGGLMCYAAFKNHCSIFPGAIIAQFEKELRGYKTSKGTIQFTVDKPLPATLVKKIVKARMAENEAKRGKRAKKT